MNSLLLVTVICVIIWMYALYSYIMEDSKEILTGLELR